MCKSTNSSILVALFFFITLGGCHSTEGETVRPSENPYPTTGNPNMVSQEICGDIFCEQGYPCLFDCSGCGEKCRPLCAVDETTDCVESASIDPESLVGTALGFVSRCRNVVYPEGLCTLLGNEPSPFVVVIDTYSPERETFQGSLYWDVSGEMIMGVDLSDERFLSNIETGARFEIEIDFSLNPIATIASEDISVSIEIPADESEVEMGFTLWDLSFLVQPGGDELEPSSLTLTAHPTTNSSKVPLPEQLNTIRWEEMPGRMVSLDDLNRR